MSIRAQTPRAPVLTPPRIRAQGGLSIYGRSQGRTLSIYTRGLGGHPNRELVGATRALLGLELAGRLQLRDASPDMGDAVTALPRDGPLRWPGAGSVLVRVRGDHQEDELCTALRARV